MDQSVSISRTASKPVAIPKDWDYDVCVSGKRELRIDLLRGLIMLIVITVHMEYYSLFSLVFWERVGAISSAEGFVGLSGMVLGLVYRGRIDRQGWPTAAGLMLGRSMQLYRVNVAMILTIFLINLVPAIDAFAVMNFVDPGSGTVYPLFPPSEAGYKTLVSSAFLLKSGPHQFQVMGLYVVLLGLAPFMFWLIVKQRWKVLLGLSWVLYFMNWSNPDRITGAQFEYAFPALTWQLLFVHGLVIGAYKNELLEYFKGNRGRLLFMSALLLATAFWFFTLNNPNPALPEWAKIYIIDRGTFYRIHGDWFNKSQLGLGRVLNNLALFVVAFGVLSRLWKPIHRGLGWLLIPLGQASLYVFIVHVFFVLGFSLSPWHESQNVWVNTAMHTVSVLAIWLMVKNQFLFRWIPR